MKILLSAFATIVILIALLIKPLRRHKWKIMGVYATMVILLFSFYNVRTLDLILPFYQPTNQMFYQSEFADEGVYPDAFLAYFLKGRTIYMPDVFAYDESLKETGELWDSGDMSRMNIRNIFEHCGAKIELVPIYPGASEDIMNKAKHIGFLNDTLRYSHLYNDIESEYGNSFYYYWFYGASAAPIGVYICDEGLDPDSDIYVLVDVDGNMYMLSEELYNKEVTG